MAAGERPFGSTGGGAIRPDRGGGDRSSPWAGQPSLIPKVDPWAPAAEAVPRPDLPPPPAPAGPHRDAGRLFLHVARRLVQVCAWVCLLLGALVLVVPAEEAPAPAVCRRITAVVAFSSGGAPCIADARDAAKGAAVFLVLGLGGLAVALLGRSRRRAERQQRNAAAAPPRKGSVLAPPKPRLDVVDGHVAITSPFLAEPLRLSPEQVQAATMADVDVTRCAVTPMVVRLASPISDRRRVTLLLARAVHVGPFRVNAPRVVANRRQRAEGLDADVVVCSVPRPRVVLDALRGVGVTVVDDLGASLDARFDTASPALVAARLRHRAAIARWQAASSALGAVTVPLLALGRLSVGFIDLSRGEVLSCVAAALVATVGGTWVWSRGTPPSSVVAAAFVSGVAGLALLGVVEATDRPGWLAGTVAIQSFGFAVVAGRLWARARSVATEADQVGAEGTEGDGAWAGDRSGPSGTVRDDPALLAAARSAHRGLLVQVVSLVVVFALLGWMTTWRRRATDTHRPLPSVPVSMSGPWATAPTGLLLDRVAGSVGLTAVPPDVTTPVPVRDAESMIAPGTKTTGVGMVASRAWLIEDGGGVVAVEVFATRADAERFHRAATRDALAAGSETIRRLDTTIPGATAFTSGGEEVFVSFLRGRVRVVVTVGAGRPVDPSTSTSTGGSVGVTAVPSDARSTVLDRAASIDETLRWP